MRELPFSREALTTAKLLADENVKAKLVRFLTEEGVDVKYAAKGMKNSAFFTVACKENRVLLTHDKGFLNTALYKLTSSQGVVVIDIHQPNISTLKSAITRLFKELAPKDFKGKLVNIFVHFTNSTLSRLSN